MSASNDPLDALAQAYAVAGAEPKEAAAQLIALAPRLDRAEHIHAAAKSISALAGQNHGLPERRIGVIGDVTCDGISAAAIVALAEEGEIATCYLGPYGALDQEVLDPNSGFYGYSPDIALIAPSPQVASGVLSKEDPEAWVEREVTSWRHKWDVIAERLPGVRILQHLYEFPDVELAGPLEHRLPSSPWRLTAGLNDRLLGEAPGFVHLIDMEGLASYIGRVNWRDLRLWFHGKVPFAPKHLALYRGAIAGALRRALGRSRKALILDLDNTLWGGVIGDDGIDGISLGPDSPLGEAFQAFAEYIKKLGERGIILGICSKNDPETALRVFDEHPHMPLRRDDFAAIQCNWGDKATNLRQIAAELNVDLSALVFADDNDAECELIRRQLPSVAVIPLTGDASTFRRKIDASRMFELEMLSAEDMKRQASYRGRRAAEAARTSATDLGEYLAGLKMRGHIWPARDADLMRLAQLEGKTNQFNLTTRRWSADQLRTFAQSSDHDVLCFKLTDRFADHGLVSSVIVKYTGLDARIVSWLMSCRVFSRGAEEFILNAILDRAQNRGVTRIIGEYVPTSKNRVVEDLYQRLGFVASEGFYELAVRHEAKRPVAIQPEQVD